MFAARGWSCSCGFKADRSHAKRKHEEQFRRIRVQGHAPDNIQDAVYEFGLHQHLVIRHDMPTVYLSPVNRHKPRIVHTETIAWTPAAPDIVITARQLCRTSATATEVLRQDERLSQLRASGNLRLEYHYTNLGNAYSCSIVRYECEVECHCTLGPKRK